MEIYPIGNAASIGLDEANSTSPWTGAACDLVSSTEQSTDGTWSIKQTSTGTGASAQVLNLTLEVGETYNISIWALAVVGTDNEQNFDLWEGFDGFSRVNLIVDGAWHEYTWSLVANATSGEIRIYTASGAANTPGEICYSDKISIQKYVAPTTTTVEVEWIDSTSVAATGNKIYRDTVPSTGEVEIADIANGVQFYSDADAPAGTELKYEVQAHDGAGDETTQEVEGDNMDYITTA